MLAIVTVGCVTAVVLLLDRIAGEHFGIFETALDLCTNILHSGTTLLVALSYIFLMHSVRSRYVIINNLFKFESNTSINFLTILDLPAFFSLVISYCQSRERFLSENSKGNFKVDDSVKFIKQMGFMHNDLCQIMENTNYCYGLQV